MHINKLQIVLSFCLAVALASCNSEPRANYKDVEFSDLFSPVFFPLDSSHLITAYSFPDYLQIDSITGDNYTVESMGVDTLIINEIQHQNQQLNTLHVFIKGIPFGLPIIRVKSAKYSDENNIRLFDFDRSHLLFTLTKQAESIAFWNNIPLEVEQEDSLYRIPIPPFAKYTENSHFIIYSLDKAGELSIAIVPMRKGKVVLERNKLRKQLVESSIEISTQILFEITPNEYHELINEFIISQLELPEGVSQIYGQYSVLNSENPELLLLQISYFDKSAYLVLNKSTENQLIYLNNQIYKINAASFEYFEK